LVGASIGRLSEEDQDRFADGLAEVIRNWPGQSGPYAAELMRTEGLRVEAADLIAAALLEAEPAFGEVEPRLDLLRAVWHLRRQRNSRVWKRLEKRAQELGEGEGEVEQQVAMRLREMMGEG
jgi:hypothetical protein